MLENNCCWADIKLGSTSKQLGASSCRILKLKAFLKSTLILPTSCMNMFRISRNDSMLTPLGPLQFYVAAWCHNDLWTGMWIGITTCVSILRVIILIIVESCQCPDTVYSHLALSINMMPMVLFLIDSSGFQIIPHINMAYPPMTPSTSTSIGPSFPLLSSPRAPRFSSQLHKSTNAIGVESTTRPPPNTCGTTHAK